MLDSLTLRGMIILVGGFLGNKFGLPLDLGAADVQAALDRFVDGASNVVMAAGMFIAALGARRAIGTQQGIKVLGFLALLPTLILVSACASYNRALVTSLADKPRSATVIESSECADLVDASRGLIDGPNKSLWILGKGAQRKVQSDAVMRQSIRCEAAAARGESYSEFPRARQALDTTWREAKESVR